MKIEISPIRAGAVQEFAVTHRGQILRWDWVVTEEFIRKISYDFLEPINEFWQTLDAETQNKIFDLYEQISNVFTQLYDYEQTSHLLKPLVAELLDLHSLDAIRYWTQTKSGLLIPTSIPVKFDESNNVGWTQERTYLVSDYQRLLPLAILMKVMIPIWEEYLSRFRHLIGDVWKDYQAFHLIERSRARFSDPMVRLSIFVNHVISKDYSTDAAILQGVGTEDFPEWVLASVVVKRLGIGDIRGIDPNSTLISYLHMFIQNKAKHLETRIGGNVKDKEDDGGVDGDHNLSKLEEFKIKQDIPAGDIEIINFYIQHTVRQINGIEPNTPKSLINRLDPSPEFMELVRQSMTSVQTLRPHYIAKTQITIVGWVLSRYISIRALPYLRKDDILSLIAIAQAYLWSREYYDIAGLISAIGQQEMTEDYELVISAPKRVMDKEVLEQLNSIYPYPSFLPRSRNNKTINATIELINELVNQLSFYRWTLTIPDDWVGILKKSSDRRYYLNNDIQSQLGKLVIDLDRQFETR